MKERNDNKFPFKNNAEVKDLFLSPFIGCGVATPRQFYLLQKRDTKMLPQNEIWKDIEGYEGLYKISSHGNVFSLTHNKILSLYKNRSGYLQLPLTKNGIPCTISVHRIVAKAFIVNKDNLPIVDHINGDKTCNFYLNLRWCTAKQNLNFKNRKPQRNKSGTKGVYWNNIKGIWFALYYKDGNRKHLGYGKTVTECSNIYNKYVESINKESG